jgi:hypothetical protein
MTGTEIQALAESYIDDSIEDGDALLWMNHFLQEPELIDVFRETEDQELTVADADTWYARTSGHLAIVRIINDDDEVYEGKVEFDYARTQILLDTADTYTITSIVMPDALSALSGTPDVNTVFHRAMALYIAGKYKLQDNDQNADGLRLVAEGMGQARRAASLLSVQDRRQYQRIKGRAWR